MGIIFISKNAANLSAVIFFANKGNASLKMFEVFSVFALLSLFPFYSRFCHLLYMYDFIVGLEEFDLTFV